MAWVTFTLEASEVTEVVGNNGGLMIIELEEHAKWDFCKMEPEMSIQSHW